MMKYCKLKDEAPLKKPNQKTRRDSKDVKSEDETPLRIPNQKTK